MWTEPPGHLHVQNCMQVLQLCTWYFLSEGRMQAGVFCLKVDIGIWVKCDGVVGVCHTIRGTVLHM